MLVSWRSAPRELDLLSGLTSGVEDGFDLGDHLLAVSVSMPWLQKV